MLPTGLGRGATFCPFVPLLGLACICVPPRPTTQGDAGRLVQQRAPAGLRRLAGLEEGRYRYQTGGGKGPIRLQSCFQLNAFYIHVSLRGGGDFITQINLNNTKIKRFPAVIRAQLE